MEPKKNNLLYFILILISVSLVVLLIFLSYEDKLNLPLPLYFLILIICDLAATGFLTGLLKSSAEWDGKIMNGNLKLAGPVVVFVIILLIGYKYRPLPKDEPFDFTIILLDPQNIHPGFTGDTLQITLGNNIVNSPVDHDGKSVFSNIDSRYLGQRVPLFARMDRFRISISNDTMVEIPRSSLPAARLPIFRSEDSVLFQGLVFKRNGRKQAEPLVGASLRFTNFDKAVKTDSSGAFFVYLKAKAGDLTLLRVLNKNKIIYSGEIPLSANMQILTDE